MPARHVPALYSVRVPAIQGPLRRLLTASVACAERFGEPDGSAGLAVERAAIAHAVASRRADYLGVRDCARSALAELGLAPAVIGTGPRREPLWPAGVVGSLTHCVGYRAAAVARGTQVRSVGIDAEPHRALPPDVLDIVALPEERAELADLGPSRHWDRLLFCAKEAVYKAWFPLTGRWLGFEQARVSFDDRGPVGGRFTARLLCPGPRLDGRVLTCFDGRWRVSAGLVFAAVVVPAAGPGREAPPRSRWP